MAYIADAVMLWPDSVSRIEMTTSSLAALALSLPNQVSSFSSGTSHLSILESKDYLHLYYTVLRLERG